MDKFRNGLTVAITAGLPVSSVPIYEYLTDKDVPSGYSIAILILISVVVAWISYFAVPRLLYLLYPVRSFFEPLAKYEGQWIHIIDIENQVDTRVCGVCTFRYNKFENKYFYSGENYSVTGELVSMFSGNDVQYCENGFHYYGILKKGSSHITNCWGEISFADSKKKITSAHGSFINNTTVLVRAKYNTERITDADIERILGEKANLSHLNQRTLFAVRYYKEYIKTYEELRKCDL